MQRIEIFDVDETEALALDLQVCWLAWETIQMVLEPSRL
jgi:hypothetical protein